MKLIIGTLKVNRNKEMEKCSLMSGVYKSQHSKSEHMHMFKKNKWAHRLEFSLGMNVTVIHSFMCRSRMSLPRLYK